MAELELRGEIVVPGEVLGKNVKRGDYTYQDDGNVRASVFGLKNEKKDYASVIPLSGRYMPKEGDMVIGVVEKVLFSSWVLDINSPYKTSLNHEKGRDDRRDDREIDLRKFFKEGDLVSVKIMSVDEVKASYAEGPRKLVGGRIVMVSAKKVPRIIGNKKSMLELLRQKTGCRIIVGQNGIVWLDGGADNMEAAVEAILKIQEESHTRGLTDRISGFLDEKIKKGKNGKKERGSPYNEGEETGRQEGR
jgi:exosome complex component RRP4